VLQFEKYGLVAPEVSLLQLHHYLKTSAAASLWGFGVFLVRQNIRVNSLRKWLSAGL
jgi:hypothetical protein